MFALFLLYSVRIKSFCFWYLLCFFPWMDWYIASFPCCLGWQHHSAIPPITRLLSLLVIIIVVAVLL